MRKKPKKITSKVKRNVRKIGSVKIDVVCLCCFYVLKSDTTNEFSVRLYPSHYNHNLDNEHKQYLRLHESEKEVIEQKMKAGVPKSRIVQDINNELLSVPKEKAEIRHFSDYYRLYNIEQGIDDDKCRKHSDDTTSVKMWTKKNPSNLIYSNFPGEKDPN